MLNNWEFSTEMLGFKDGKNGKKKLELPCRHLGQAGLDFWDFGIKRSSHGMQKKSPVESGIRSQEHPEKFPIFPSKRLFPTQYPGKASPPCGYLEFFLFFFFFNPKQTTPSPLSEFRGCFPMNPCGRELGYSRGIIFSVEAFNEDPN